MRAMLFLSLLGACQVRVDPVGAALGKLASDSSITRLQGENELARFGPQALPRVDGALEAARREGKATLAQAILRAREILVALRHFPMGVGYRWVYASGEGDVVFEVTGKAAVHGVGCFAVRRTLRGKGLLFYLTVSRKGVRIHRVGEDDCGPPYLEFSFPLADGKAWTWRGLIGSKEFEIRNSVARREEVSTPAGVFRAVRVREEVRNGPRAGWTDVWLAEDVGVVKLQGKSMDLHNSDPGGFTWELASFRKP